MQLNFMNKNTSKLILLAIFILTNTFNMNETYAQFNKFQSKTNFPDFPPGGNPDELGISEEEFGDEMGDDFPFDDEDFEALEAFEEFPDEMPGMDPMGKKTRPKRQNENKSI